MALLTERLNSGAPHYLVRVIRRAN